MPKRGALRPANAWSSDRSSSAWSRSRTWKLLSRLHRIAVLAEFRHALRLLEYHPRVVRIQGAGRVALELYRRVRPDGNARATVAARLVAHDVPPFLAVHEAVAVGEWCHVLVQRQVVARADDVADLVRDRISQRRTGVMNDDEGLVGIGPDPRRKPATRRIVDDEGHDIGMLLVAQLANSLEWALSIDHAIEVVEM